MIHGLPIYVCINVIMKSFTGGQIEQDIKSMSPVNHHFIIATLPTHSDNILVHIEALKCYIYEDISLTFTFHVFK